MSLAWIIGAIIIFYVLWRLVRATGSSKTVKIAGQIRGAGEFECEVVGESNYQHHLERIAGGRTEHGVNIRRKAILVLEDDNRYDKNAVRIYIEGLTVGYLPRELAKSYRRKLEQQEAPIANYTCDALVVGGWDRGNGDVGYFGVRLDLPVDE